MLIFKIPVHQTVFAVEKHRFGLRVRTVGITRAATKIGLANLAYNIKRNAPA